MTADVSRALARGLMTLFVAAAVTGGAGACRSRIQLGAPDAGDAGGDAGGVPACAGTMTRTVLAELDPSLEPRALTVANGIVHVLSVELDTGNGIVSRVSTEGGSLVALAAIGVDPSAIAVNADASYVFAATGSSAKVFRIDPNGGTIQVDAQGAVTSIVADGSGGAFWTVPSSDSVLRWDLTTGAVSVAATSPRATSLLRVGTTLYVTGNRAIRSFDPAGDTAVRLLAERCDVGIPALLDDILYCADAASIARVDLTAGTASIAAPAQPGATDVVVIAGRVFWRMAPDPTQGALMALPLDGIGGATVLETTAPRPLLIAADACNAYFTSNRTIVRLAF